MGLFDFISRGLGTANRFRATAPRNEFQAHEATLDESQYGDLIRRSQEQALAGGGAQSDLAAALKAQMEGRGPSLAQQQLQNATQQTAAQAAGQMASVNGINPALAARLIGKNVADVNQQAAGQSATTRLQEQLSTEQLLAQALQAQRGQDLQAIVTGGQLQQGQNANRIQNNLGTQQINAGTAAQNANLQLGAQQINAGVAGQNANTNAGLVGGIMQGAGALAALSDEKAKAKIQRYGDDVLPGVPRATFEYRRAPGVRLEGVIAQDVEREYPELVREDSSGAMLVDSSLAPRILNADSNDDFTRALKAARVVRYANGGDVYIPQVGIPDYSRMGTEGGDAFRAAGQGIASAAGKSKLACGGKVDFRAGGTVPGTAKVPGDDERNDTVDAKLSPEEIVLPRSVTKAPDAAARAAEFVAAIKAKKKGGPEGYARVLAGQQEIANRLARLERQFAEGGEVDKPKDEEHARGWDVAEWINAHLPDVLSGRQAVVRQRERMRQIDEQTTERN